MAEACCGYVRISIRISERSLKMIVHLNGDFETVDYERNRSVLVYDNVEDEEYPIHWHNAIEIIMPLENDYEVICGGKEYRLKERDIIIIPSGTLHNLKAKPGRRLILLCDARSFSSNPALSALSCVLAEPLLINADFDKEFLHSMDQIIKDIYVLYSNFGSVTEVYIYIKVLTLLAKIREYQLSKIQYDDSGKYADKFQIVLKYIENNYASDITLNDLAKIAGYSEYHFSRIFKKYSNTTFINFLNRRRIKASELLLLENGSSITDIAMQVGFSSLTTFNRVFKNINGCTPTEYKKLYKTEMSSNVFKNM